MKGGYFASKTPSGLLLLVLGMTAREGFDLRLQPSSKVAGVQLLPMGKRLFPLLLPLLKQKLRDYRGLMSFKPRSMVISISNFLICSKH